MSENATANVVSMPAKAEPFAPMFQALKDFADRANGLAETIKTETSVDSDRINDVINNTDDTEVIAAREALATLRAKVEDAEAKLKVGQDKAKEATKALQDQAKTLIGESSDFDVKAARSEFLELRKNATDMRKSLKLVVDDDAVIEQALEAMNVHEVTSLARGGASTGATGIRRPRLESATVNGDVIADPKGNVSFTTLGSALGVESNDLRSSAFKAAGTDDLSTKAGEDISFEFVSGDKSYSVVVTPR